MLILMTSPDTLIRKGAVATDIAQVLINAKAAGHPVGLISNHAEPSWFAPTFGGKGVQFLQVTGRQNGDIVSTNAKKFSLEPYDVLVLASKDVDVQMGKNGGAVLIAAGWSTSPQLTSLGIRVDSAQQLQEVIDLTTTWSGQWWYSGTAARYGIRALADLSSHYKAVDQQIFGKKLTATVKGGGSQLNALLVVTARSLLMDGVGVEKNLLWGVYPSSNSANNDSEILSDFTHRLRTTVSRVQFSKRGEPLFIRHKSSHKRSGGGGGDRNDPVDQVISIHLNPFYQDKNRIEGKHVVVIDDCTTYGVSFGVAAAFLRRAGATSMTGVALGKFGNQSRYYEIDINSDPYKPVGSKGFAVNNTAGFPGVTNAVSQQTLQLLIP